MNYKIQKLNDILGFSSATLCLIHCLIFPLISISTVELSHNHWLDLLFAGIGLYAIIGVLKSLVPMYIKIILLFSISMILISISYTIISNNHTKLIYFGGIGMIIGHLLNFRHHKH